MASEADLDVQPDLSDMNLAHAQTLVQRMGIKIIEASAERVVGTMPVAGNTQPYGLLHGGASCVLAETLGSVGSALHAGREKFTVGIEINATHHRAVAAGEVTGVATQVHAGRTLATYEILISDDHRRRVCTARLTCLLRDAVPGDATPDPEGRSAGQGLSDPQTPPTPMAPGPRVPGTPSEMAPREAGQGAG